MVVLCLLQTGETPLHKAAQHYGIGCLRLLLKLGADPDIPFKVSSLCSASLLTSQDGSSLLDWAIANDETAAAVYLLQYGASVKIDEEVPVDQPVAGESILKYRTRVRIKGSILHWVVGNGFHELLEPVLKRGAKINAVNSQGETALHVAVDCGEEGMVRVLLKHGAHKNIAAKVCIRWCCTVVIRCLEWRESTACRRPAWQCGANRPSSRLWCCD